MSELVGGEVIRGGREGRYLGGSPWWREGGMGGNWRLCWMGLFRGRAWVVGLEVVFDGSF